MGNSDFLQWQETFDEYIKQSIRTMYVAKIDSYNSSTRRATVKILGEFETDVDEYNQIPNLTDVLVGMPVGGGFFISLPVKKGDSGRLVIFSQDIDKYKTFGGINKTDPNHNFNYSNSIFIPDCNPFNASFPNHSAEDLVIGSINGDILLRFTPNKEMIVTQNEVEKIKINSDGSIDITATSELNLSAPAINLTGAINITGAVVGTQTITVPDVKVNGKSVKNHVHTNPEGGNVGAF